MQLQLNYNTTTSMQDIFAQITINNIVFFLV